MKNMILLLTIFFISATIAGQEEPQTPKVKDETGTLLVMVQGFKNTDGQLLVALYNNAGEFLDKDPFEGSTTLISANQELIKFENIPYGDYAVVVLHDINKDGKLDKNILGIPTEGYGFSNNAMDKYGPPSWMQASFVFAERAEAKVIDLQYGIPE
jgi:uncharacterized protein (DUF2141 family)